ncbi:MAG: D-methionine transport system substrate-binding protein [Epulopiscium sp.]|jgi:D-methionine transport system substrate-binding protein|uniref:Lipoprotein n=1 Tax=Defluviitalea raffinosedens TaxID=1450156 RepID=A0A7C8HFN0_9FIRM|nr:MetQ/NlpA family ABC transporter substrate-binding protein [Defluviitalea raffinosedens]KAE9636171.1 metal ABC transporter substrate-binding protein [Defluviitalea raffinosedens]MBM7684975.1 D-methionine transport system substrate-binding protein [Defluviitalea raffinosedens]MBZ4666953.1 ABC-type metal ion transport system, periplasmic component [Defluviitaleaceae bacterium]MDK2786868.1 D-methionine transport system substrate-binding protein [Candidatus Epulonipiscium sp.]
MKKISVLLVSIITILGILTGCASKESKTIIFGVAPGPYGDMIVKGIKPGLEKKGYKVEIKEFSDYVQPNLALANKEIDANLFQHLVYLNKFAEDHGLELSPVINVPTAAVGLYSKKVQSIDELSDGAEVTIANDPTNLARALRLLEQAGLITLNKDIDPSKASEKDIESNPKNLKITPVEAAQLPRTLDSVDLAAINGNYAISAGIDLSTALVMEELQEEYKNLVAVRTEDINSQFVKDIKEVVESEEFREVIENPDYMFKAFQKPAWFLQQ